MMGIARATATLREASEHMRDRNDPDREMLFRMNVQAEHLEDRNHRLHGRESRCAVPAWKSQARPAWQREAWLR